MPTTRAMDMTSAMPMSSRHSSCSVGSNGPSAERRCRQGCLRVEMCIDMRVDMHTDTRTDRPEDVCRKMRVDTCVDMRADVYIDTYAYTSKDVRIGTCKRNV